MSLADIIQAGTPKQNRCHKPSRLVSGNAGRLSLRAFYLQVYPLILSCRVCEEQSGRVAEALSDDLRKKVLGAYAAGKGTLRELAERFDVSHGWVKKIRKAELVTGSQERVPQRRRRRIDTGPLRALVDHKPDIVLHEMQEKLAASGVTVSQTHLWRLLKKMDLRLKKSRSTPQNATRKKTVASGKSSSGNSRRSRPRI